MPIKNSFITGTDQFCGAGGSSNGMVDAGIEVKMALNHDPIAIETHNTNHPQTDHHCTDIQACEPKWYPSTTILATSPECTNQTNANGKKKPTAQLGFFDKKPDASAVRSRATMWDVVRFTEYHKYEIVIVENVVEATKWRLYPAWLNAMYDLGYQHKSCFFNSMFFKSCPQSRDRVYMVFWKKGNKAPDLEYRPRGYCSHCATGVETYQSWKHPQKKAGKYNRQYVYRCSICTNALRPYFYAAFNVIDWSDKGEKIGQRKRGPLSPKTIARIQHGIDTYWTPKTAIATKKLVGNAPLLLTTRYSSGIDCRVKDALKNPMPTQPADASHSVLFPFIAELRNNSTSRSTQAHLSTLSTSGAHHLLVGNYSPGWTRPLASQMGTITTSDHHGLVTSDAMDSFLSYYYSGSHQNSTAFDPLGTIPTKERIALVSKVRPKIDINDCHYRMLKHHEVKRGMAFPDDYVIIGNVQQKFRQLGNAVTPPVMEWISKRCVQSLER